MIRENTNVLFFHLMFEPKIEYEINPIVHTRGDKRKKSTLDNIKNIRFLRFRE